MHERKQHVILSALKLFQAKGFVATSVQDIIEEANISKGTFYNYFSSKNEFLQAILEYIDREEFLRRERMLYNEDKTDKQIFIKQVLVRIEMNREFNLLPMLESIFHSKDIQLKKFVKNRFIMDLAWIHERFLDIYGKAAEPYLNDATIMFYSIIQQMSVIWRTLTKEKIDFPKLVAFTLRRMDCLIEDMIKTKDQFLFEDALKNYSAKVQISQAEVIQKLEGLLTKNELAEDIKEMIKFLINEFESKTPRISIIEAVGKHLRNATNHPKTAADMNHVLMLLWQYVDYTKNK